MEKQMINDLFYMSQPFPESEELPEGAIRVDWHAEPEPLFDVLPDIVYQTRSGEEQHIQLFKPLDVPTPDGEAAKFPLIVFIPGSAWHRQNVWNGLMKAIEAVKHGYAFALVEYRPSDIAPFPAQIEDAKSAIRFLKLHGDEYAIDKDRVALWGCSSGGHTAICTAITGDGLPGEGIYPEVSCAVNCVVDWYGPTDIVRMNDYPSFNDHKSPESPEGFLIGQKDVLQNKELANETSPLRMIDPAKPLPPFLMMHGGGDGIVPFNQSVLLYDLLREQGRDVTFYKLTGSGHGTDGFGSKEALDTVFAFIDKHI